MSLMIFFNINLDSDGFKQLGTQLCAIDSEYQK